MKNANSLRAWLVVLTSSLFFFYIFIQQNMFDAISSDLMQAFHVDGAMLGTLSSFFYAGNVLFLFVAAPILDRYSSRNVILAAMTVCIMGVLCLSFANSFFVAASGRLMMGIASAFCFLGSIRIASRWFPPKKMAFVTGVIVTIAMTGGMVAQTPMTLLVESMQWRHALLIDASLGVIFLALIALLVQDCREDQQVIDKKEHEQIRELGFWQSFRMAYFRLQSWFAGIYCCLMNLPIAVFGGLWGVMYLTHVQNLSKIQASYIISALFAGTVIGAPLAGWISDKMGNRRKPMMIGAVISLVLIAVIMLAQQLSISSLLTVFFLLGLFTSTQVISYALVAESSPRVITAMAVSVVNISVMSGGWIFEPVYGYLLDKHAMIRLHQLSTQFIASDFQWAAWLFPVAFIIAFFAVILIHETYNAQPRVT